MQAKRRKRRAANQKKRVGKDRVVKPITPLELVRFARKEPFVIASIDNLLHLCDEAIEARQQFFDKRSGKPITS